MYAKVFTQIFDSSIADDYKLRHFFMDLLVLADINGVVDMTPTAIAGRTRIPLAEVQGYLASLECADPESRTADHEGRRIARLDEHRTWGWFIINYHKFRAIASEEQRREKTKLRTRKWRKPQQTEVSDAPVTLSDAGDATQTERQTQTQPEGAAHEVVGRLLEELGSKLYKRSAGQPPSYLEQQEALIIISRPGWVSEKDILVAFGGSIAPEDRRFDLPKTLIKLLTEWDSALDKARNYKRHEKPSRNNPRNDGIAQGPTDYGEAARRKLERQALEAKNRAASEAQGT